MQNTSKKCTWKKKRR